MKYKILFAALLLSASSLQAQNLVSKVGYIKFYSHTPVEDIEAHNRQVVSILNTETGALQFKLLIKSFEFEKKLMQEHFNENYMESDKFPKASFEGNISDLSKVDFTKEGEYPVEVAGNLTIHGVTKAILASGMIGVTKKSVIAESDFMVKPEDYDIRIPDVVRNNIAIDIQVSVRVPYSSNK